MVSPDLLSPDLPNPTRPSASSAPTRIIERPWETRDKALHPMLSLSTIASWPVIVVQRRGEWKISDYTASSDEGATWGMAELVSQSGKGGTCAL